MTQLKTVIWPDALPAKRRAVRAALRWLRSQRSADLIEAYASDPSMTWPRAASSIKMASRALPPVRQSECRLKTGAHPNRATKIVPLFSGNCTR